MSYRKKGGRDTGGRDDKNLDHLNPRGGPRNDRRSQPGGLGMQKTSSRRFESSKDLRDDVLSHDTSLDRHSSGKAIGGLGMTKSSPRRGKENLRDNRTNQDKRSKFGQGRDRGAKNDDLDLRSDSRRSNRGREDTDRYGGRRSPEFGQQDSEGRLETFGNRDEVHKRTQPNRKDSRAKALDISRSELGEDRTRSKYTNRLDDKRNVRTGGGRPPTGSRNRVDDRRRSTSKPASERGVPRGGASTRGRGSERGSRVSRGATSSYDDPRYERHMSSKSAKKAARQLNFTEDKRKREKNWLLDFNAYRPILHLPDKMEQPEKDTISYLIKLDGVNNIPTNNIPILKQKGVTPNLIYSCTLYDDKERCFIGRSYNSRPIQLKPTFNATDPNKKEFIFMHTSSKELSLCVVVESYLEIVDLNNRNKTQYVSLGFSIFHLFDEKGVARVANIPMYLGTPRFLVCAAPFKDMQIHPSTLAIQIKEYPPWNKLKNIVPSTTLCGMNDLVPGIIGNKMSLKSNDLQLSGKEDVVCSDIHIMTSHGFEDTFLKFLEEFIFEKYRADDELLPKATCLRIGYPRIRERKMIINYDNTWRSCGNEVFIALEPPVADTYKALGFVEIKDFILDPNVALIFKIQFRLDMPTKEPKKYEVAFFTIAWGYYLPNFTEKGEMLSGPVNCALRLGPGTAPDGSVLWTPDEKHQENYIIEMSAELTSRGKFDPETVRPKSIAGRPQVKVDHLDPNPAKRIDFDKDDLGPGLNTKPEYDQESAKIKRQLETEKKISSKIEREKQELQKRIDGLNKQLLDKNSGLISPQIDLDLKNMKQDERRNHEIMKQKYESKLKEMREYYEEQMQKQTSESKSPGRYPSSPGVGRHQRGASGSGQQVSTGPAHQLPYASSYLADPSMYHPSFYPPDDRSRLIGQSRYIDEDLKILPPPPQVPIELPTTFDLTRDDEIAFVKLGIKEEILKHDSLDEPDLEIEMRNELQASEFTIRFIAFKPPLTMPFGQSVPRRMYFKFNFFTFSEATTEACALKDPDGTTDMVRELIPGQQYLLDRIGKVKISEVRPVQMEFQIDKTVSKVYDENIMFYKYLLQRELSIDIFDADSHLHYGTCRVNLKSMLKQMRPGVVRARNCEIAAFESSNRSITGAVNMGHLQILMSHQGKKESEVNNLDREKAIDDNNFLEERKQPSQKHKFNKKVKSKPIRALYEEYVSNKPDDLYEKVIEEPYHIEEEESEEIRKKMRVERLKKFKFKQKVLTDYERSLKNAHRPEEVLNIIDDPSKPEWLKNQSLKQIETLRDYTKPHVIENVLKEHIKSMKQLYIVPGTPSFFKYNLKNPFSSRTVFTINIIDPDKIYLGEVKEFRLINNNNFEWEFWHSKRK